MRGNGGPAVAQDAVQVDDHLLLLEGEAAALDVGAEVVRPPEPAALAASQQTCVDSTNVKNHIRHGPIRTLAASRRKGEKTNEKKKESIFYSKSETSKAPSTVVSSLSPLNPTSRLRSRDLSG